MRRIAITLLLLGALTAAAQHNIKQGSLWYNGALIYNATLQGEKVLMSATDEGEEIEFMLVPVKGKPETYRITHGPNDAMMVEEEGAIVKHEQKDAVDILCFYKADGSLYKVMTKTDAEDHQELNVENWMRMVRGEYTMADGTRVTIDWKKAIIEGTYVPVEAMTFNGHVTGHLIFDGDGTPLNGCMEVVQTIDGLLLYPAVIDEYEMPHRLSDKAIALTESNPNNGRFDFVSNGLLHGSELYNFERPQLRLMRNFILARHGYVFQSRDLQEYFGNEPWYKSADSNEEIQLSFPEQINIDLIKYREKEMDAEQQ